MSTTRVLGALCACVVSLIITPSYAALIGVLPATPNGADYQAYYDDVADLTWLANANAAVGSAYDTYNPGSGGMDWATANAWAASLSINGVTDWRLPNTLQPDSSCGAQNNPGGSFAIQGYGGYCTGSEMGNLFYNILGGVAGESIRNTNNSNYDLFSNVQTYYYWSSTEYAPDPAYAWDFDFSTGGQDTYDKTYPGVAWAVHSGNAGVVPVPAAVWLFGSGLLGLVGLGRQRRHSQR